MRCLTMLLAICVVANCAFAQEAEKSGELTVSVHGLRIVKAAPAGQDYLPALGANSGTAVALLISAPEGGLIAFDDDASKLTRFLDDTRFDLLKAKGDDNGWAPDPGFGMMPTISEDGKYCMAEVNVNGIPAKGAKRLAIGGKMVITTGTKQEDATAKSVALKKGTEIKVGPVPLKITEVGKPEWGGDYPLAVTFEAKAKMDAIASIEFFDADGKEIKSSVGGSSSMGFMNKVTVTRDYHLEKKVDTADIKITYWADMEKKTVPFELVVDMGL